MSVEPLWSNVSSGQTERGLERIGPSQQRKKKLKGHMTIYLPILVASPAGSGPSLNITSPLKPTERLHNKKGWENWRLVPSAELC